MLSRPARRRIEKFESKVLKSKRLVLNLCGEAYRLGELKNNNQKRERCYAAQLDSCDGPMSKEHYISKNILNQFPGSASVSGLQSLNANAGKFHSNLVTANILCKYHNEFLSPLDDLAGKVFKNFQTALDPKNPCALIWGPSLERWFLKVLIGLVAAKQTEVQGKKVSPLDLAS